MVLVATWMVIAHSAFPADHPLHISAFWMTLLGKFLCFAMLALAMDLIWGYTGILSLGQGLFFALGGYLFGMYLMRQIGRDGVYQSDLPDFMVFLDWKALPWYWSLSDSFAATLVLIVAASFWVMGQPVQVRADILQLALTVWAIDKAWSLLKGLLGDLRGRDGMDMLAVAGHWLSTLLASALFALLVLGVVSVIWSYAAPPVLGFFGIKL